MPATDAEQLSRRDNWHASSVEDILGCARAYYLNYELGIDQGVKLSTIAGTAHHTGVEFHERARMADHTARVTEDEQLAVALTHLEELMEPATADQLAAYAIKKLGKTKAAEKLAAAPLAEAAEAGLERLRGEVRAACHNWWHTPATADGQTIREMLLDYEPLAIEVYLKAAVVAGADPQAGTTDGVYVDPRTGEVLIVDQKTSGDMRGWGVNDDEHRDQPAFYAALLVFAHEELGLPDPGRIPRTLFCVSRRAVPQRASAKWVGAAVREVVVDELDLRRFANRVREAQAVKDAGVFAPDPGYKWCVTCPFRSRCVPGDGTLAVAVSRLEKNEVA